MKVLVTGSTGLLGNNLVRQLSKRGDQVISLVRSEKKGKWLLGDTNTTLVVGDMRNIAGFAEMLNGCEAVFHTAAYFREYYQPGDHAQALNDINIKGTLNLMAEADKRGVRRFIHVSSAGSIGMKPDGEPGDEETPPLPGQMTNLYFKSKVEGDQAIRAWQPKHGLEIVEILPGWMWGPGDAAPTAAGQLALDFLARKLPAILDGGACVVDARDVADAMIAALDKGVAGQKYIVGGVYYSLEEILKRLEEVSGVPAPKIHLPHYAVIAYAWCVELFGQLTGKEVLITREGINVMHAKLQVTSEKAKRELGTQFRPLPETLKDVVAWYKENSLSRAVAG
ncbi:MAG: SDR family oxidoreductase [Acidobacteriota bacterium]